MICSLKCVIDFNLRRLRVFRRYVVVSHGQDMYDDSLTLKLWVTITALVLVVVFVHTFHIVLFNICGKFSISLRGGGGQH